MKKFIFISILSAIFFAGHAQHTLSFSQGLLVSTTQTVPNGKTWKIVSFLPNSNSYVSQHNTSSGSPPVGTYAISVNSNTIYVSRVGAGYYALNGGGFWTDFTNVNSSLLPMWLPAGTTLAASTGIGYISVLEFTIN